MSAVNLAAVAATQWKGDSNGHLTQAFSTDWTGKRPCRREKDPTAAGALRRHAAVREDGAGEHGPGPDGGGGAAAITDGKRWPDRQPSGYGLGVDRDRPVRTGRSRPTARLAA